MQVINIIKIEPIYKNIGQEAERQLSYTLTGEAKKADNVSHKVQGDVLDIQVKSARATVCKGTDIEAYLQNDGAKRFAYVLKDFTKAYIMDLTMYIAFVNAFATVTRESQKNGGGIKLRLKSESKAMLEWLSARA